MEVCLALILSRSASHIRTSEAASLADDSRPVAAAGQVSTSKVLRAEGAQTTSDLSRQSRVAAVTSLADKVKIKTAMEAIKFLSSVIAKHIQAIDEIALKANLLALHAAVEAPRAGEFGMDLALAAYEVRNLAQRCARSVTETAVTIEGALQKIKNGIQISSKVVRGLQEIMDRMQQVNKRVAEMTAASKEQT